jgi:hypothetical protein
VLVAVVVVDEDVKHSLEVPLVEDEEPVEKLRSAVRAKRSAIAFVLGVRTVCG